MAASVIATTSVHASLLTAQSCDLRNYIDNQATSLITKAVHCIDSASNESVAGSKDEVHMAEGKERGRFMKIPQRKPRSSRLQQHAEISDGETVHTSTVDGRVWPRQELEQHISEDTLLSFADYRQMAEQRIRSLEESLRTVDTKASSDLEAARVEFDNQAKAWHAEKQHLQATIKLLQTAHCEAERELDAALAILDKSVLEKRQFEATGAETWCTLDGLGASAASAFPAVVNHNEPHTAVTSLPAPGRSLDDLLLMTDDAKEANAKYTFVTENVALNGLCSKIKAVIENERVKAAASRHRRSTHLMAFSALPTDWLTQPRTSPSEDFGNDEQLMSLLQSKDRIDNENADMQGAIGCSADNVAESMRTNSKLHAEKGTSLHNFKPEQNLADGALESPHSIPAVSHEHPVVLEYVKAYNLVYGFKQVVIRVLKANELSSAQDLDDFEPIVFSEYESSTMATIQQMTQDIDEVLSKACMAVDTALASMKHQVSTMTSLSVHEASRSAAESNDLELLDHDNDYHSKVSGSTTTLAEEEVTAVVVSVVSDRRKQIQQLQDQIDQLQKDQAVTAQSQSEDIQHNTELASEVQGQVNDVRQQLTASVTRALGSGSANAGKHHSMVPVFFTHLDAERNAKNLKRAFLNNKIGADQVTRALEKMEAYMGVPQRRLSELAKKYVHQTNMKQIDDVVHSSRNLQQHEYELIKRMEDLQGLRHKQWQQKMEAMGQERMQLAAGLAETLDTLEKESGIFLIKPTLSSHSRRTLDSNYGSPANAIRHRTTDIDPQFTAMADTISGVADRTPHQTSHLNRHEVTQFGYQQELPSYTGLWPSRSTTALRRPCTVAPSLSMWTVQPPQQLSPPGKVTVPPSNQSPSEALRTPRMVEMDINRITYRHERTSSLVTTSGVSGVRAVRSAATAAARSYVTVSRAVTRQGRSGMAVKLSNGGITAPVNSGDGIETSN